MDPYLQMLTEPVGCVDHVADAKKLPLLILFVRPLQHGADCGAEVAAGHPSPTAQILAFLGGLGLRIVGKCPVKRTELIGDIGATIGELERVEPGSALLPERFVDESLEFAQIDRTQRRFLMVREIECVHRRAAF